MSRIFLFFSLAVLFVQQISAQIPFHRSFSQPGQGGLLYRCIETSTGDFYAAGQVTDYTSFENDMLLIKTTSAGNPSWIRVLSGSGSASLTGVAMTTGDAIVAVGTSFNMTTFLSEAIVLKYNATGTLVWSKKITLPGASVTAKSVASDATGNLYVLGAADVAGAFSDYLIMQLSPEGNLVAANTFGTSQTDFPLAFQRTTGGDFLIAGWQNSGSGENIHVLKVSASFTVLWNKLISGSTKYFAYDIGETQAGQVVMAGRYDETSTSYDVFLAMLDGNTGGTVWAKHFSAASGTGTYAYGLAFAAPDIIALTGIVEGSEKGTFLIETDLLGNLSKSSVTMSPGSTAHGYGITGISTGGFLVCGPMEGANGEIVQLVRTDATGQFPCNSTDYALDVNLLTLPAQILILNVASAAVTIDNITLSETSFTTLGTVCLGTGTEDQGTPSIVVYPNPSDGHFTITHKEEEGPVDVAVISASGMTVHAESISGSGWLGSRVIPIRANLPEGLYLLKLSGKKGIITTKLMIGSH